MQRRADIARLLTCAATVSVATGCAPAPLAYHAPLAYRALSPPSAAANDAQLTFVALFVPAEVGDVGAAVDVGGAPVDLEAARLAPPGGEPCRSGARAAVLSVEGRRRWQRPLHIDPGHRVTFEFAVAIDDTGGVVERPHFATLDVTARKSDGGELCVRLPLPPATELRRETHWSAGASFRIDAPVTNNFDLVARAGRWLGPLRLGAELGLDIRRCLEWQCPSRLYLGAPAAVTAEIVPPGIELAYTALPIFGTLAGDRYLLHGPRMTLRLTVSPPRAADIPGGPQRRYWSIDFILAHVIAAGVANWSQTTFALGFTWDTGL